MAKGALTKEMRSIVSKKGADMRKRLNEKSTQDRIAGELGGFAGAVLSGFIDGRATDKKAAGDVDQFEVGPVKVDVNVVTGGLAAGVGMWMGKGPVAHGLAGSGMTQLKISAYRKVMKMAAEAEEGEEEEAEE